MEIFADVLWIVFAAIVAVAILLAAVIIGASRL